MLATSLGGWACRSPSNSHRRPAKASSSATRHDLAHLRLSAPKVSLLKKTLQHYSQVYTSSYELGLFAVSWHVGDVPKPPEDLTALLPPKSWPAPELLVFALRGVQPEFAALWVATLADSIAKFFGESFRAAFELASPSAGAAGAPATASATASVTAVLLVFHRQTLVLGGLAVKAVAGALAARFSVGQASVCLLCVDAPPSGAAAAQLQRGLLDSLRFEVGPRVWTIEDHAVLVLLGCRNFCKPRAKSRGGSEPGAAAREIDVVVHRRSAMSSRAFAGNAEMLKAGVMKLVLQVDGEGTQFAHPQLALLNIRYPQVDVQRLHALYSRAWGALRSTSLDVCDPLVVKPRKLSVGAKPLRPFERHRLKFTLSNPNAIPAAYTVLVINEDRSLQPLMLHSLAHRRTYTREALVRARRRGSRCGVLDQQQLTSAGLGSSAGLGGSAGLGSGSAVLGGSAFLGSSGGLTSAGLGLGSGPLLHSSSSMVCSTGGMAHALKQKLRRSGLMTSRTPRGATLLPPPASARTTAAASEHEQQLLLSQSPSSFADDNNGAGGCCLTDRVAEQPPSSGRAASSDRSIFLDDSFQLSRHIEAHPLEGVVLAKSSVEVTVTVMLRTAVLQPETDQSAFIAVRMEQCNFDSYIDISVPRIEPAITGLSLEDLAGLGERTIAVTDSAAETNGDASGGASRSPSPAASACLETGAPAPLPVPKELWWLLEEVSSRMDSGETFNLSSFLFLSALKHLPQSVKRRVRQTLRCLEVGAPLPPDITIAPILLALERLLLLAPSAVIPRDNVTELNGDVFHIVCRAFLLSLPLIARNIFMATISMVKALIDREVGSAEEEEEEERHREERHSSDSGGEDEEKEEKEQAGAALREQLKRGAVEWLCRVFLRDTPRDRALPIASHFIVGCCEEDGEYYD